MLTSVRIDSIIFSPAGKGVGRNKKISDKESLLTFRIFFIVSDEFIRRENYARKSARSINTAQTKSPKSFLLSFFQKVPHKKSDQNPS